MPGRWQVLGGSAARALYHLDNRAEDEYRSARPPIFRHFSYAGQADSCCHREGGQARSATGKSLHAMVETLGEAPALVARIALTSPAPAMAEVRTGVWEADSDLVLVWDLRLFRLAASS